MKANLMHGVYSSFIHAIDMGNTCIIENELAVTFLLQSLISLSLSSVYSDTPFRYQLFFLIFCFYLIHFGNFTLFTFKQAIFMCDTQFRYFIYTRKHTSNCKMSELIFFSANGSQINGGIQKMNRFFNRCE